MTNLLEQQLRAVQHSIAEIKRQLKETNDATKYNKMKQALLMYYDEEERLLAEIGGKHGNKSD